MDYEKKYKAALERCREFYAKLGNKQLKEEVEDIFPELKESGNIRIIKAIKYGLDHVFTNNTTVFEVTKEQCLAWLDKQGEQKPADKVEPKKGGTSELTPFEAELFSMMSDAWQGYQLGEEVNIAEIVKEHSSELLERANKQNSAWSEEDELHIRELESLVKQVWATAERENDKDTIHKMSDLSFFLKTLKPQLKQEWSEEDKEQLDRALYMMEQLDMTKSWDDVYNWLKTLKDRVQPQLKQEWSEEDEKKVNGIITILKPLHETGSDYYKYKNSLIAWLKSLRPQNTWKPSDEQMEALAEALSLANNCGEENAFDLRTLYEQLKKLREE